jgi:dihydrofolate reductase
MRKLSAFIFTSLNGFFEASKGDISWHKHGEEENSYAVESLKAGNTLLFGSKTYQMMASYWPTPIAIKNDPIVANGINKADKIVFSRTLKKAGWNNTRIIKANIVEEVRKLKITSGSDMTLMGSGSILTRFAEQGLIDEYQIMLDPVVIGKGATIFNGIKRKLNLRLTSTRTFKSGVILLSYHSVEE